MEEVKEPITDYFKLDLNGTYTYSDYMLWHFKERVELIRGKIFKMSPAPNTNHQRLSFNLTTLFDSKFKGHKCQIFFAPFDVRLPVKSILKNTTVVQPDLCIICDESKLDEQGCNGAPDLVVEILSPGNARHEMRTKFDLYEESGVKEYWIVEPANQTVLIYTLQGDKYIGLQPYTSEDIIESPLFPEIKINAEDLFYNLK
ncbi:MAG: Uma2 family endonuclease [Bacteroidia bacterium]